MSTDDTTTSGTAPAQPLAPRRILALIALADDLPIPHSIQLIPADAHRISPEPILALHMHNLSDASRWTTWLGATRSTTHVSADRTCHFAHSAIRWHGWTVMIYATAEPTTDTSLDPDTRDQLEKIADVTPTGGGR